MPANVSALDEPQVPSIDLRNIDPALFRPGTSSADSGRLTGDTLAAAIEFAKPVRSSD
jgi:hypothetical protein